MEIIFDVFTLAPRYLEGAATIVGGFATIAAITPTRRDDSIVGKIAKFIDLLGANFGYAKNK
jgi:hypothetical protein